MKKGKTLLFVLVLRVLSFMWVVCFVPLFGLALILCR